MAPPPTLPQRSGTGIGTLVKIILLVMLAVLFTATVLTFSTGKSSMQRWSSSHNGDDHYDKKITKSFDLKDGGTLHVDTDLGDLKIVGRRGDKLEAVVYLRGDEDEIEKFDVSFEEEKDGLRISARYRDRLRRYQYDRDIHVRIELEIPKKYNLDLETSGGDIALRNISGMITGETSGGDIIMDNLTGEMRMETSGGVIHMEKLEGSVYTETSGGDIRGTGIKGKTHASTSPSATILPSSSMMSTSSPGTGLPMEPGRTGSSG